MPRFALLEHTGHPDDPAGRHYDLLLEDGAACRTWRLSAIPAAGGPAVVATPLPPHRLAWLDTEAAEVSGGRGCARRVDAGGYEWLDDSPADDAVAIRLAGGLLQGRLRIEAGQASTSRITSP